MRLRRQSFLQKHRYCHRVHPLPSDDRKGVLVHLPPTKTQSSLVFYYYLVGCRLLLSKKKQESNALFSGHSRRNQTWVPQSKSQEGCVRRTCQGRKTAPVLPCKPYDVQSVHLVLLLYSHPYLDMSRHVRLYHKSKNQRALQRPSILQKDKSAKNGKHAAL
jgi:hypothetical protein